MSEATADLRDLADAQKALTSIIGAILRKPAKTANVIVSIAASKFVAAGIVASTFGAIGLVGVASTGVAIGTLSGAAATSATLYWIGSIFGLGVAGGGAILTGGAFLVAVPAVGWVRRKLQRRERDIDELADREQALLYASLRLATALQVTAALAETKSDDGSKLELPSQSDMRVFSQVGLAPLIEDLRDTYFSRSGSTAALGHLDSLRLRYAVEMLELISKRCFEK